ncbi:MAG: hypothetical protein QG605_265, partial [Euryarchaeota archaeon]|nr:hypothetical protein [Euryarchaeota archaeon]
IFMVLPIEKEPTRSSTLLPKADAGDARASERIRARIRIRECKLRSPLINFAVCRQISFPSKRLENPNYQEIRLFCE